MQTKISPEFAELLGAFAGDGWISKGNTGISLFISGNPKDEQEYYNRIKELFASVFGINVNPRAFPYWGTFGILVCNRSVIQDFIDAGMPVGNKSAIVKVPEKIINNKRLHIHFVRGFFDTDGCIYFQKSYNKNASKWQKSCRHKPAVQLCSVSKELMYSLHGLLRSSDFNFVFTKPRSPDPEKNRKNIAYKIKLEGKENVKKFFNEIQPKNQKHINKFNKWLEQGFY